MGTTNNKLTCIKTLAYSMGCESEPTTARSTNPLHVDSSSGLDIFCNYGENQTHERITVTSAISSHNRHWHTSTLIHGHRLVMYMDQMCYIDTRFNIIGLIIRG